MDNATNRFRTSTLNYFFVSWRQMPVMFNGNALMILSDGQIKNRQFIKIGAPVKIHQDAKGFVALVVVLQCH